VRRLIVVTALAALALGLVPAFAGAAPSDLQKTREKIEAAKERKAFRELV
jgi:hypothetical protein